MWWRMDEVQEGRGRVWPLYGWFCGLMVCGSCFGVVTWTARMMILVNYYKGDDLESQGDELQHSDFLSISYNLYPIFIVPCEIELLRLSAANFMVLDRMSEFAAGQDDVTRKRWAAGGRVVMAVVVLGNAVGLAAQVDAAVHYRKAAERASEAYALCHTLLLTTLWMAKNQKEKYLKRPSLRALFRPCSCFAELWYFSSLLSRLLWPQSFAPASLPRGCVRSIPHLCLRPLEGRLSCRFWVQLYLFLFLSFFGLCFPPCSPSPLSCEISTKIVLE
jgi:hypothetical protein